MFLTTLEQYRNKFGECASETYKVTEFESGQEALEFFEKEVQDDLFVVKGYRNPGVELIVYSDLQAKTVWHHTDGYVFAVKLYTLTNEHPMTNALRGI